MAEREAGPGFGRDWLMETPRGSVHRCVVASHVLQQRRHPSAAIGWVFFMFLLPYAALPLCRGGPWRDFGEWLVPWIGFQR